MKVIEVSSKPKSTAECVEILNSLESKDNNWKRKNKYKLGAVDVRVFKNNENEFKTIVSGKFIETRIFNDLDFSNLKTLIDRLKEVSKMYYTHDYGCVYLNPYTLDIIAVGGDGGFGYSSRPKSEIMKKYKEDYIDFEEDFEEYVEFNQHEGLESIRSVEWEAEYIPEDIQFIEVCEISNFY